MAPPETKLLAYNCIIRPTLEYAAIVWDPYTKRNIDALEKIQRKAVRFIFSKYRPTDSPSNLMQMNNIQTLKLRRKIQRIKFLYLLQNNQLSLNPQQYIQPLAGRFTRHRHAKSLTPYFARTNTFKYSLFPRTIAEWNNLPISLLINPESIECVDS